MKISTQKFRNTIFCHQKFVQRTFFFEAMLSRSFDNDFFVEFATSFSKLKIFDFHFVVQIVGLDQNYTLVKHFFTKKPVLEFFNTDELIFRFFVEITCCLLFKI